MATAYSFKSNVNELFDTHKDTYVVQVAEVVTQSVDILKKSLRNSDEWSVGSSDIDGTHFSVVKRIPTMTLTGVHFDSTVVFTIYKHRILINIKFPFIAKGENTIRRLSDAADNAFKKSAMPCDFPITVALKFIDDREFHYVEYTSNEEGTKE
ncbi:hypothetical protein ACQCZE_20510 [Escherichia coli]|uniref:hypothetical protein n=1 Tax=Escherichia coli TaxID=562 RepID=UPI003CF00BB0